MKLLSFKFFGAALREFFRAKAGNTSQDFLSGEFAVDIGVHDIEKEEIIPEDNGLKSCTPNKTKDEESELVLVSVASSLTGLNDAADEFFDVPDDLLDVWSSDTAPESCYVVIPTFGPNLFKFHYCVLSL